MTTFEEKLAMKQDIDAKIGSVKASLEKFMNIPRLQQTVGDARARLNNLILTHGGEAAVPAGRQGELAGLKAGLKDAQAALDGAVAQERTLREELAALKEQRAALNLCADAEEVISIQGQLAEVDAEIAKISAAIDAQSKGKTTGHAEPLLDLEARRAELLADAAMGKDVKKGLAEIDKAMATAEKQIDGAMDKELAVTALETRLSDSWNRRAELAEVHKAAVAGYLVSRAALAAEEYREAAEELGACVARLVALDKLLDRLGAGEHAQRMTGYDLVMLTLPGVRGEAPVFRTEDLDLPGVIATEAEIIRTSGIILSA